MTINQIIDRVDATKPNAYTEGEKKRWLSQIDSMAFRDVISTHEDGAESFDGYTEDTDGETELLIPDEYSECYIVWIYAKIDFANQEISRYSNSMIMFNALWADYCNGYNRAHMPRGEIMRGVGGRIMR